MRVARYKGSVLVFFDDNRENAIGRLLHTQAVQHIVEVTNSGQRAVTEPDVLEDRASGTVECRRSE